VCVGVPIQCGYGGVVSLCSLKHYWHQVGFFSLRNYKQDVFNIVIGFRLMFLTWRILFIIVVCKKRINV